LQTANTGQVNFAGINLTNEPQQLRKVLGYLPQEFGVYPNMSCFALLRHIATLKGLNKAEQDQQIPQLMALTNLTQVAKKNVATFSGGMRQRFGIAQALLGRPKIIILDEPTSGLDPRERDHLYELLVTMSKSTLVLLSTHIVEDIEDLCNHVAFLLKGQVVASDDVASLLLPLQGKIWQTQMPPQQWQDAQLLSKRFRHSQPFYRLYSAQAPTSDAQPCEVKLQDRYFFELLKQGVA